MYLEMSVSSPGIGFGCTPLVQQRRDRAEMEGSEEQSAGLGDFVTGSGASFLLFAIERLGGFRILRLSHLLARSHRKMV